MTFNPNIPRATDLLINSQGDLLANNTNLNTIFSKNHIPLNVATNAGKHTFVELVNSAALPAGLATNEGTLYVKTVDSRRELFYTNDNSGNEWQLTSLSNSNFATFGADPGWTFLPGGMLMQWGTSTKSTDGTVSFSRSFGTCYAVQCTILENNSNRHFIQVKTIGSSSFKVASRDSSGNDESNTFTWIAIGAA